MSNSIDVAGNPAVFHHFSCRRAQLRQAFEHAWREVFGRFAYANWELLTLVEPIMRFRTQLRWLGVHASKYMKQDRYSQPDIELWAAVCYLFVNFRGGIRNEQTAFIAVHILLNRHKVAIDHSIPTIIIVITLKLIYEDGI